MKKKTIVCLLAALFCLLVFAGCGQTQSESTKTDVNTEQALSLNKKYISQSTVARPEGEQCYYVFTDESNGYYHYYDYFYSVFTDTERIQEYTVSFRYYIVEDTISCFFDSVQFSEKHNDGEDIPQKDWTSTFGFTENYLLKTNGTYYLNEDFLKNEIVNFGK